MRGLGVPGLPDPLGPARGVVRAGGRGAAVLADAGARVAVAALARAVDSPRAGEAVDVLLRSTVAERAARVAVEGPLVSVVADAAIRTGLVERVAGEMLDRGVVERVARRVADDPELDRLLTSALDSPRTAEIVARALDSEGMQRLATQAIDSRTVDASVNGVLASQNVWLLVDEIARSPAVTEAISHQGAGFADQVAEEIGARTRTADARLERAARRLLHRTQRVRPVTDPP